MRLLSAWILESSLSQHGAARLATSTFSQMSNTEIPLGGSVGPETPMLTISVGGVTTATMPQLSSSRRPTPRSLPRTLHSRRPRDRCRQEKRGQHMVDVATPASEKESRPHGIASGCSKCKHACALAVDRSSTYVQCGNPKCYDYGYWTHGWPILANYTAEERRCKSFAQASHLTRHPQWGFDGVSEGYATAWQESKERLGAWYQWRLSHWNEKLKPSPPTDVHPLGLPDEEERYYITRSYVRIHHEGEEQSHA